uniref:UspA domain-containing protein n=1 Tax=Oryza rufipogon TaxID=4529 RepID=A0A0E0NL90_ORYRU
MATGNLASVVVAVDGSEESMNALRWALDNLRLRPDGALVVLHVEVPAFTQAIEAHQRRITQAILDHALKICSEKNVEVKTDVVVGDPKEKICEVTANLKADLLVMGCRAFGPLKRMFLGSVSNYCINNVVCPVVVIKGT